MIAFRCTTVAAICARNATLDVVEMKGDMHPHILWNEVAEVTIRNSPPALYSVSVMIMACEIAGAPGYYAITAMG